MSEHTIKQLKKDLAALGIMPGDTVLMHSSYRSLGVIEDGAAGFFRGFIDLLGAKGTLILPALSYRDVTEGGSFDILETPSCVGYLPEYFRTQVEGVKRSLHPTHSCSVYGAARDFMIGSHELDLTPVGANSPFRKLPLVGGKLLMLGCGLAPCTSMHGVEETVMPPYLLTDDAKEYTVTGYDGIPRKMYNRRHAFNINGYAQRYVRVGNILRYPDIRHGYVLDAECWLIDAAKLWELGHKRMAEDPFYFVDKL